MTSEYTQTMTIVAGSFGAKMDAPTIAYWADLFKEDGISIDQIKAAAKDIIRTRKYKTMPTYAEFIEFCSGTPDDKARIQADEVLKQIRAVGSYGKPKFNDPVTTHIMTNLFNWQSFCSGFLEKNTPFFIKDFIEKYNTYSKDFRRRQVEQIGCEPRVKGLTERIG